MKLCKDCKHFGYSQGLQSWPEACAKVAPANLVMSPVDGHRSMSGLYEARQLRLDLESIPCCGTDAKWFEPKESLIKCRFWKK